MQITWLDSGEVLPFVLDLRCAGLLLRLLLRAGGDKLLFDCKLPAGATALPVESLRVAGGDLITQNEKISKLVSKFSVY